MSRFQHLSTRALVGLAGLVAVSLVGFGVSGVGAGETVVEIHRMAEARFDGFGDGPVFIAIVGTDDRPGVAGARADAVHVVGINPAERRATVLNIPRDSYVPIPGRGNSKITNTHPFGGAQLVGETLTAFTGANVQFVITTNFEGFTGLVNEAGGVSITIPIDVFDSASSAAFPAGAHHLSGEAALALARARKGVPRGDFTRTDHQGLLLTAAHAQFLGQGAGAADTIRFAAMLMRHLKTTAGVSIADLYRLGRLALDIPPENVMNITMPGAAGSAGGASVVFPADGVDALFADFADDGIIQNPPAQDGAGKSF